MATSESMASDNGDDDVDDPPSGLHVDPSGPLVLGYGQEQRFDVLLLGEDGLPLPGEPVQVSLVGAAHNASVSPFEFVTDESGAGSVTFKAPEKEAALEVRFSSPAASKDFSVDVSVSPGALGITVDLDYQGKRDLVSFFVELHEGATCEQSALLGESSPVAVQSASSVPAQLWFEGLLAGQQYAARARGYSAHGEERAGICVFGLEGGAAVDLVLVDLPYGLAGAFALLTRVEADGSLEPAVQSLAEGLEPFLSDVPGAILAAIRDGLADAVAIDQFDQIREEQGLDGLIASDLESRGVDPAAAADDLWDRVRDRLALIDIVSRLEIGAAVAGVHSLYHTVEQLSFEGIADPFQVVLQDQGQGTAQASADDPDLLDIGFHAIGLGLGGVLMHAVRAEVASGWETASVAEALQIIIDCEAVLGVLSEPLADVATPLGIHAGCLDAMAAAGAALDARKTQVDAVYSQIGFSGSCRLDDPGIGDQVGTLIDGVFAVTWGGVDILGPMASVFGGEIE